MRSVIVVGRPVLAVLLLLGLFLMHGLQTFCNDGGAGGHEMGRPGGAASTAAVAASSTGHTDSMTAMGSDREVVASVGLQSAALAGGGMMLDLCVAILVGGVLLVALRGRALPWSTLSPAVKALRTGADWTRLRPRPPGRMLSILCVLRT